MNQNSIIVTYSDALFEKIPLQNVLKENTLTIVKGERVTTDFITEVLFEYGFERTDFVYEPGQFAIRGNIVDVSRTHGYSLPDDFFGDELIDRTFDVEDQQSPICSNRFHYPKPAGKTTGRRCNPYCRLPPNSSVWIII